MRAFKPSTAISFPIKSGTSGINAGGPRYLPELVKSLLDVRTGYSTGQKTKPTAPIFRGIADAICGVSRNHMH
ncbi:hypothetical protein FOFC_10809 [Fusarium oxysporum]|nr:hypothetical protein FOFC_10809 [Fusarium oxysporum]